MDNKALKFALYVIIFLSIALQVSAIEVDGDDTYIVSAGEKLIGSFVIDEFVPEIVLFTDSPLISFNENGEIHKKIATGEHIVDEAVGIKYYVQIPEDIDVGVYRTTIKVTNNKEIKYINIKISVQNSFFKPIFVIFSQKWLLYGIIFLILLISLIGLWSTISRFRQ